MIKNPPAHAGDIRDMDSVPGAGQDNLLEEDVAAHSNILAWRIPWTGEPAELQSVGCKELNTTEET